jgi:hypothetical protein
MSFNMPIPYIPPKPIIASAEDSGKLEFIRLLLLGFPGTGKTVTAASFPKPVFINLDDKLPKGVASLPFCNPAWVKKTFPNCNHSLQVNVRDALVQLVRFGLGSLATQGFQTIVLDSLQLAYAYFDMRIPIDYQQYISKAGNVDGRSIFQHKLNFAIEIVAGLKTFPGNFICTSHEMLERSEEGKLTGRIKAAVEGQFPERIGGFFNLQLRQVWIENKKTGPSKGHYLQVQPDSMCKPSLPFGVNPTERFIEPSYDAIRRMLENMEQVPGSTWTPVEETVPDMGPIEVTPE